MKIKHSNDKFVFVMDAEEAEFLGHLLSFVGEDVPVESLTYPDSTVVPTKLAKKLGKRMNKVYEKKIPWNVIPFDFEAFFTMEKK